MLIRVKTHAWFMGHLTIVQVPTNNGLLVIEALFVGT